LASTYIRAHAVDDDVEMQLAHAFDNRLIGFGIGMDAESRVFFGSF